MKTLAVDLSTRRGTIALAENGEILCAHDWPNNRRTSAPFFAALNEIIRKHGAPQQIIIGLGPGSYTGTRIAISAGIGLHATGGAALSGMASVCAISDESEYCVVGDAKRASFFFATVYGGSLRTDPELLSEGELNERISSITTIPIYTSDDLPRVDGVKLRFPSAKLLCQLARTFPQKLVRAPLSPIYLRAPHITVPRKNCINAGTLPLLG
jgi:tRNA threonylcarbamoyl adenosine modification protein YeaZ